MANSSYRVLKEDLSGDISQYRIIRLFDDRQSSIKSWNFFFYFHFCQKQQFQIATKIFLPHSFSAGIEMIVWHFENRSHSFRIVKSLEKCQWFYYVNYLKLLQIWREKKKILKISLVRNFPFLYLFKNLTRYHKYIMKMK